MHEASGSTFCMCQTLDYCDVIYHKPMYADFYNKYYSERAKSDPSNTNYDFSRKIESVQYNAALAITGCIRGTNRERLYSELGLTSLYDRRRFHRLSLYLRHCISGSIRRSLTTRTNRYDVMPTHTGTISFLSRHF